MNTCWVCLNHTASSVRAVCSSCHARVWHDWYWLSMKSLGNVTAMDMYAEFLCICWINSHFQGDIEDIFAIGRL